ncbi:LacI family DNA-binding transcriptional regulator [Streptomyces sp. NBC_00448]|uniref:LacI family DNA-binding transcriptional regulator n=1 Tax=Streptomyces sp. NBC_00448 TaxID=2903652 RepID=UPI002E2158FD
MAAARRPAASRAGRGAVTIEDVAKAAGVSRQTVSNVLNAPARVRAGTLTRVQAAIEELGYRPDQSARSLRTGERRTLAYLAPVDSPSDPNPLMGGFLEALVDAAGDEGYRILLFRPSPGTLDSRPAIDEVIAGRQADGFLLADVLRSDYRVDHLVRAGVPFAVFGRTDPGLPQHWVDLDNKSAMRAVAAHLAAQGHRRVGYLGAASELPWTADRREGFRVGLRDHGLEGTSALEPLDPTDPADTVEAVHALLRSSQRPTAIAAASDMLAVTAYEAIRAAGLVVGRDVAVVGCHDIPLCRILTPALTSVRLPLRTIASGLVARLLAQIRGERAPGQGLLLPGELVVRASSSRVVEA